MRHPQTGAEHPLDRGRMARHARRKRALRIAIPVAAVVAVGALVTSWALLQPHVEHNRPAGQPVVAFVGNSFTGGSAMDSGASSRWPAIVSEELGLSDTVITAGSSGYVHPGVGLATYGDLAEKVPSDAAAVVILGSDDDASEPYDQIKAAALATFATIRREAPHAQILAIATFWVDSTPPEGILTSRDAVRDAAADAHVDFADPIASHWLVADPSVTIGADGLHPTDAGHAELAQHIEPLLAALLKRPAP
ncbi:MAG: SGNH/GDSL hydrolase family protein [Microbacteriaceae bacterium]